MTYEQLKLFLTEADATVVEAMQKIDTNAKGILFIVDNQGKIAGVVTEGDIRRWLIITGDLSQKDLPKDAQSGLEVAVKVLNKIEDISIVNFTSEDVVRHPLVQKIVNAYE